MFETQRKAEVYGRKLLKKSGGGELVTQNKKEQIRSKDIIANNDPCPPKDTEY